MTKGKKITIVLMVAAMVAFIGCMRSDHFRMYQLEWKLNRALDEKSMVDVGKYSTGEIIVLYNRYDERKLDEIQRNLNLMMAKEDFWLAKGKKIYEIQLLGERRWLGGGTIGTTVTNANPLDKEEYTTKGIYMIVHRNFELPEGQYFEDVKYVSAYLFDVSVDCWSFLKYYPNLTYLDLGNEEISQRLFDHIKSMVPENCEIVNYYIDEGK